MAIGFKRFAVSGKGLPFRFGRTVFRGILAIAIVGIVGCSSLGETTRVLFWGNSYSFSNNFRNIFSELSGVGGHKV